MTDGLTVTGGVGGLYADLADMRATAHRLDTSADVLRELAGDVLAMSGDGDIAVSAVLSPGTAAAATGQLVDAAVGLHGLLTTGVRVEASALRLQLQADLYEGVDSAAQALEDVSQEAGAWLLGRVLLPAGLVAVIGAVLWEGAETNVELLGDLLAGDLTLDEVMRQLGDFDDGVKDTLNDLSMQLVFGLPGIVDVAAGSPHELLAGVLGVPPFLSEVLPFLPGDFEEATMALIAAGRLEVLGHGLGWFDDGVGVSVHPVPLTLAQRLDVGGSTPPGGIGDVFRAQGNLMMPTTGDPDASRVRVVRVPQPDGSVAWVVQVPGTQEWSPTTGGDVSDITTNLLLEATQDARLLEAVAIAMEQAGVSPTDPVMVTGHSQGGIAAASFASNPTYADRFNVTHVVTGGSPIARIDLPADVQVLSLEHDTDLVPRLEGDANRPHANHTTVVATATPPAAGYENVIGPHSSSRYEETGRLVDASSDPSIDHFLDGAGHFLTGDGEVQDYEVSRR